MRLLAEICQQTHLNANGDPKCPTQDAKLSVDSIHFELWHDGVSDETEATIHQESNI